MSMTIDDADLIRSFKAGQHDVFGSIVAEHRPELLRHARRRTVDMATAEDLVQETFIRAYRGFGRIQDDSRVRPWLHQILANVCIDEANRRHRDNDKTERFSCDAAAPLVGPSIEQQLGLDLDDDGLDSALASIPDSHRDALTMRFVDELDYDEIAAVAGVTEPNARARVSRARSAVRRAMQGVASIPIIVYCVTRRSGRNVLAAGPPADPTVAMRATESVSTASRMAVTFQPAMDAANAVAVHAPAATPLVTKAAVGIGALAVAFSAAPEQPPQRAVAVTEHVDAPAPLIETTVPPTASQPLVAAPTTEAAPPAEPVTATPPATTVAVTTSVVTPETTTTSSTSTSSTSSSTIATTVTTVEPISTVATLEAPAPVPVSSPADTATTTPATTAPATTLPPTTLPPLTGGVLASSVSVVPAGPRLDLSGSATLTIADLTSSGPLSGRLGVEAPDAQGAFRIDGTLTVQLDSGSIDIRIAGHATTPDVPVAGETPTNLAMSGLYRASGTTGRLELAGNFTGSLAGETLTLTLSA